MNQPTGTMNTLPHAIFRYIGERFSEGYINGLETLTDKKGKVVHRAEIRINDISHFLTFNENGLLLRHLVKPLFEGDHFLGNAHRLKSDTKIGT